MRNKWLSVFTVLILAVFLLVSACAKAPAPTTTPAATPPPSTKPTATPTASPTQAPATTPAPTQAEKFELKYALHMVPDYVLTTGVVTPFVKDVEANSNGRIKITVFYAESLGKTADQYDLVAKGIADFTWANPANTPGRFPLSEIINLSFAYQTAAQSNAIAVKLKPLIEREFPDVKLLAYGQSGPYQLAFSKKRVAKLEDLKGLKVRSMGGVMSDTVTLLGGVPVSMSAGEMYTAMERGTVDGLQLAFSLWSGYKIQEVSKYGVDVGGLGSPGIIWPMNKDKFNKLPPDLQKVILDAAAKLPANMAKTGDTADQTARKDFQTKGIEIITIPPEEIARWKEKVMPTYDKWLEDTKKRGLPADEVMAAFKKAIEEVKK